MYQALYRKYRSQNFDQLVGQDMIAKTLKQAVANKTVSHAYLFSGPRGTGKTSVAKIFAKAMNCPNQVDGEPCNQCDICHDITNGSLEDVIEIDAASNNGVDEIRDIRDKSTYAPSRTHYKVYIIDEVHMLSTGAFNALLKTLEEPTKNVVFILATTEIHKIPATILSRVQRFEFKAIKHDAIVNHLKYILEVENVNYDQSALTLIAKCAEGGMRDALSILDQALSLSDDNNITLSIAEEITGSISRQELDHYVNHLLHQNTNKALDSLNTIFDSGKSMVRFTTDLLMYLRDLLIIQSGGQNLHNSDIFEDNLHLEQNKIFKMIHLINQTLPEIKNGLQPKIYAEMMTIQLAQVSPVQQAEFQEFEDNLQLLKQEISHLKDQLAQVKSQPSPKEIKSSPSTPTFKSKIDKTKILKIMNETLVDKEQSKQYLTALKEAWNDILDHLSAQDRALLLGSEPVLANQENAILAFDAAFNAEQAMNRTDLNAIFGNTMSQISGFSPNILALSKVEFQQIRQEFSQNIKKQNQTDTAKSSETAKEDKLPSDFAFLADKVTFIEE